MKTMKENFGSKRKRIKFASVCSMLVCGLALAATIYAQADFTINGKHLSNAAGNLSRPNGGTTYVISGNVRAGGANLPGATMVLANLQGFVYSTAVTDANGDYLVDAVGGESYTLSVYKDGYNFNPAHRVLSNVQANQTFNFQNGTRLCVPAPAGQSGENFCQNAVGTAASTIQNGKIAFERFSSVFTMDADGGNQMRLAGGHFPSWSPDGTKILFNRKPTFENDEEIYVMNADGSNPTRITVNDFQDFAARWSPDGSRVVFVRLFTSTNTEIYTMNTDGTDEIRLTENDASDDLASFSPNGAEIVFASDRINNGGNFEIYKMDADGSDESRLTFDDFAFNYFPAWSPSGSHIIFTSNRNGLGVKIWRMGSDGNTQVPVTNDSMLGASHPVYSPDGTLIAFGKPPMATDLNDIFKMDALDNTIQTNLTSSGSANEEYPSWQATRSSVGVTLVAGLNLTFTNVTGGGSTVATPIALASAGALPTGFRLIPESVAYDVRTSASYAGNIEICFTLSNINDQNLFDSLVIFHNEGGILIDSTSSRNFAARKICASVTSLSPFVVAAPAAPTAASVTVSGRVLTPTGRGLTNAIVSMTDASGNTRATRTTSFGYFRFEEVEAGQTYIFSVRSKRYRFAPQVVTVTEDFDELNFTAEP